MTSSEKIFFGTFRRLAENRQASMHIMYPQMRVGHMHGGKPCWVQVKAAPYDAAGFYHGCGTAIAVELKESSKPMTSLPIIAPGKKGSGLQYHQLEGLADAHEAGAVAFVLLDNAGSWGRLSGEEIVAAKQEFDTSLKVEARGKTPAFGSRSISWERFERIKSGLGGEPIWLPPSPCPPDDE